MKNSRPNHRDLLRFFLKKISPRNHSPPPPVINDLSLIKEFISNNYYFFYFSKEKPVIFKAQPVPEFDKIEFKPELQHQTTKQKPFSFEERNKQMQAKKEQKIQNVLEEEKKVGFPCTIEISNQSGVCQGCYCAL